MMNERIVLSGGALSRNKRVGKARQKAVAYGAT
jgi:hypothetical protein